MSILSRSLTALASPLRSRAGRMFSSQSFVQKNKHALAYGAVGLTFFSGVAAYKMKTDPLNNHASVARVFDAIADSNIGGDSQNMTRGWLVSGKIYSGTAARLNFSVYTDRGLGKVSMMASKSTKEDVSRQEPWKLRGDEGEEVWVPKAITVDLVGVRERYIYDPETDKFILAEKMPMNAVAVTDFFHVGFQQIYGPLYDKATSMSKWQYLMVAGAVAMPLFVYRTWATKLRPPLVYRQVAAKLPTNKLLTATLGEPVNPSTKWKGRIEKTTAAFHFEVEGSNASGTVDVQAYKQGSNWEITSARFRAAGSSRSQVLDLKDD